MSSAGVYIVCAPHPRVGVTTIARLLGEWCAFNSRPFEVYDTDSHFAPMQKWFSPQARAADLDSVHGQIALFDSLLVNDGAWRVVDVWCRSYRTFFELAAEIGFFQEAHARGVPVYVLFAADCSEDSIGEAALVAAQAPHASLLIVANEGAAPLGADSHDWLSRYPGAAGFRIGPIDPAVQAIVEAGEFALSDFVAQPPQHLSLVVRARLREWVSRAFAQFKAFDVRLAMRDSEFLR
ncbi:MAG: hypothetical protein K2Y29_13025 [Beijerinckiaceae bacterium]|nr:hypothetical protein [Beijerinckiaceae bacterium]